MIEVREADYFIAVAEELHFGRAAARLQMSQPPLSQAIRQLERKLGVELLHRTTRAVRLTSAGAAFLRDCRELVGAARAAETTARRAADGQAGELRIGAVTSAFTDLLPRLLARHHAAYPRVTTTVDEIDSHEAASSLHLRRHDVVLGRLLRAPAHLRQIVVHRDEFVLVTPDSWPTPPDNAAASDLPWVWIPRAISPDYHDQVVACCQAAGFTPQERHTARSITSQLAMVGAGLGVALAPTRTAHTVPHTDRLRYHPIATPAAAVTELAAAYRDDDDPLVANFVDMAGIRLGSSF